MDIFSNLQENYWVSFFFPNISGGIINTIILFLLLLTFLVSHSTKKRYKKTERLALSRIRQKVEEKVNSLKVSMRTVKETKNEGNLGKDEERREKFPDILMDVEELREGVDKGTIIYKRLDIIDRMRKFRVKINADFLQQFTLTSEASKSGITLPMYTTNLAMFLGLLGTFLGLAIMVTKINMLMPKSDASNFSVSTLMASLSGMETVFGGMSTAFSTSILGLITTIVGLTLNYHIRRYQTAFFHELETFTVEKLIPVTVPPVESEHLLEEVSFQLKDSFNTLNNIISQNNEALFNLNTIESSFNTIVDQVRNITQREEARSFANVMGLLSDTNKSLRNIIEQLPKMVLTMKDHSQLAERKIEALIDIMKKQQETFDKEVTRIMKVREGGLVVNIPSVSKWMWVSIFAVIVITGTILIRLFS